MVVAMLSFAQSLSAVPYGFDRISSNASQNVESQLSVDVTSYTPAGSQQKVLFTFSNSGPTASSIADVYFDFSGLFLGWQGAGATRNNNHLIDSDNNGGTAGVDFSVEASPANLPGGNSISFSADLGADSDSPVSANGVNPGETLGIILWLVSGSSFTDVISALNNSSFRIGLHVQAIGTGGQSDAFVSIVPQTPPPVGVPDAGTTLVLLGSGLIGVGALRRRFSK